MTSKREQELQAQLNVQKEENEALRKQASANGADTCRVELVFTKKKSASGAWVDDEEKPLKYRVKLGNGFPYKAENADRLMALFSASEVVVGAMKQLEGKTAGHVATLKLS